MEPQLPSTFAQAPKSPHLPSDDFRSRLAPFWLPLNAQPTVHLRFDKRPSRDLCDCGGKAFRQLYHSSGDTSRLTGRRRESPSWSQLA